MNTPSVTHQKTDTIYRLPCRGCEQSCVNYKYCDGKMWRMEQEVQVKASVASISNA